MVGPESRKVPVSVRLSEDLVLRLREDAQKSGRGFSEWVAVLLESSLRGTEGEGTVIPSPGTDWTAIRSEIESLREEIKNRFGQERSGAPGEESDAMSFLALQMGEVQQGIERLSHRIEEISRPGGRPERADSPEVKEELVRLCEAAEHQAALTGEILRIGDSVREIRERLQKLPGEAQATPSSPEKNAAKKRDRSKESEQRNSLAEKKEETRQFGWAVGILLVFAFGVMAWEMIGWYNGGDSGKAPIAPKAAGVPPVAGGIH